MCRASKHAVGECHQTSKETVAAYGEAATSAAEKLTVPEGILPAIGGLRVELSSTAMVTSMF